MGDVGGRAVVAVCVLSAVALACTAPARPPGRSWSVATHPRVTDRYARLLREFLATADPVAVRQRMVCERTRLGAALGPLEAGRRIADLRDTVVRGAKDRAAYERADKATALQVFEVSGAVCDSINAASDREDGPVPPAADSLRGK